jgi:tetratricopeptide (TPR) repeat protein
MKDFLEKASVLVLAVLAALLPDQYKEYRFYLILLAVVLFLLGYIKPLLKYLWNKLRVTFDKVRAWYSKRKNIKVGFGFESEVNRVLIQNCKEKVKGTKSASRIKFFDVGSEIKSRHDAEKIVGNSKKKDLIVWSEIVRQKKPRNLVRLNFSHKDSLKRTVSRSLGPELITLSQQEHLFKIYEDSYKTDLDLEQDNIYRISVYIIGLILPLKGDLDSAIKLLEELYEKIPDTNPIFKDMVKDKLQRIYLAAGQIKLSKNKSDSLPYLRKALELGGTDINTLSAIGVAEFNYGSKEESKRLTERLFSLHADSAISYLNMAFFRVRDKSYSSACRAYSRYEQIGDDPRAILQAIIFLEKRSKEEPGEIGYLFGRALLNWMTGNKCYESELKSFVRRAEGKNQYSAMLQKAKEIANREHLPLY